MVVWADPAEAKIFVYDAATGEVSDMDVDTTPGGEGFDVYISGDGNNIIYTLYNNGQIYLQSEVDCDNDPSPLPIMGFVKLLLLGCLVLGVLIFGIIRLQ